MTRRLSAAALALLLCPITGCTEVGLRLPIGGQCELTSECEAPLICRLGRCRKECLASRDCALGLRCVLAPDGVGVCQLPEETDCELSSECPESLFCASGQCVNECADARDCPGGDYCDEMSRCATESGEPCVYNSECDPYPLVCELEQCQVECRLDRDCPVADGYACVPHAACQGPCMCRRDCSLSATVCAEGSECVDCLEADCGAVTRFCERMGRE